MTESEAIPAVPATETVSAFEANQYKPGEGPYRKRGPGRPRGSKTRRPTWKKKHGPNTKGRTIPRLEYLLRHQASVIRLEVFRLAKKVKSPNPEGLTENERQWILKSFEGIYSLWMVFEKARKKKDIDIPKAEVDDEPVPDLSIEELSRLDNLNNGNGSADSE